jgi:GT2 family glycosyltransferase
VREQVRSVFGSCLRALCASNALPLKTAAMLWQWPIVASSKCFDADWYLANNPDVRAARYSPALHYLRHGAQEGRNPSENFDTEYYLARCPEALPPGFNPIVHFELWGRQQGYDTTAVEWRSPSSHTPASPEEARAMRQAALGADLPLDAAMLAIGIVTYNNPAAEMARLFRSIEIAGERLPAQIKTSIVVIDNGEASALPVDASIRRLAPRGNIGFAAAHDLLMREAFAGSATHYLATNPDGCFHPNCLDALMRTAQAAGHRALVEAMQFPDEHPKSYDPCNFDTPWATAACLLISRSVFEAVGGFDPAFFMYCEDVDLSWRALNAGFAVKICPRALFMHHIPFREYDAVRHRRFLQSGLVLAEKWGNAAFAQRMRAEMQAFKFSASEIVPSEPQRDPRGVTDFQHLFGFAPSRWAAR